MIPLLGWTPIPEQDEAPAPAQVAPAPIGQTLPLHRDLYLPVVPTVTLAPHEMAARPEMVQTMLSSLKSTNPGVRISALNEIAALGEDGAAAYGLSDSVACMASDPEPQVQCSALLALGAMGVTGSAHASLLEAYLLYGRDLQDAPRTKTPKPSKRPSPSATSTPESLLVRRAAAQAIGMLGGLCVSQESALEQCLQSPHPELVADACVSLGELQSMRAGLALEPLLEDDNEEVVCAACMALGRLNQSIDRVGSIGLPHASMKVQYAALISLAQMSGAEAFSKEAVALLRSAEGPMRHAAAELLLKIGAKAADQVASIARLLNDKEPGVRVCAAIALGGIGEAAVSQVPALERLLQDTDEDKSMKVYSIAGINPKLAPEKRKPACAAAVALSKLAGHCEVAHTSRICGAALRSKDFEMRMVCAGAMAKIAAQVVANQGNESSQLCSAVQDILVKLCKDQNPWVTAAACDSLAELTRLLETESAPIHVAGAMAECMIDNHPLVRAAAVRGISKMGEEAGEFINDITTLLNDKVAEVRVEAIWAVAACGELGSMHAFRIARLLTDRSPAVRAAAVGALAAMGPRGRAFADDVMPLLQDGWPEVRVATFRFIGGLDKTDVTQEIFDAVRKARLDNMPEVRRAAAVASAMLAQ